MHIRRTTWRITRVLLLCVAVSALALLSSGSVPLQSAAPSPPMQFREAAPQGFGDRQNSGTWSMLWWNGKLYVGTVRSWFCWAQATFQRLAPNLVPYPPTGPDFECAPDPMDLPLQAEIWRYTPETEMWERVYQSPNDVEIPGSPGKYTACDVGYRDMIVFKEADGTEALYVCGVTVNAVWPGLPPPRILRSTDGETFEPIPQDPGTVLGDLGQDQSTFRDFEVYNGRLYVINGEIQGHGSVLEAEDPASGNDSFRWVLPQDVRVFEMAPYNGYLYLGLADRLNGYSVVKTDATGTPPYTLTPVITNGGFLGPVHSPAVVSMHVFEDRLYVGTDIPADVIRINPDDSWDLLVGMPRETPDGWKYPLSGMGAGFDWMLNVHIWRMQDHEGVLYLGTLDSSTRMRLIPGIDERLGSRFGFDLYETSDGHYFHPITVDGFGDKFQTGIRTFASTPHGLFVGTVSYWYGLRIWQGTHGNAYLTFLPLISSSTGDTSLMLESDTSPSAIPDSIRSLPFLGPPERLEVEAQGGRVVLSWEHSSGAVRFHVFRSDPTSNRELQIPDLVPSVWIPGPFVEVGTTEELFFVDPTMQADRPYHYYVIGESVWGTLSQPSNLVRVPSLASTVSFESLQDTLDDWLDPGEQGGGSVETETTLALRDAHDNVRAGDLESAIRRLAQLRRYVKRGQVSDLAPWRAEDLEILLAKLARRVRLVQDGVLAPWELD